MGEKETDRPHSSNIVDIDSIDILNISIYLINDSYNNRQLMEIVIEMFIIFNPIKSMQIKAYKRNMHSDKGSLFRKFRVIIIFGNATHFIANIAMVLFLYC